MPLSVTIGVLSFIALKIQSWDTVILLIVYSNGKAFILVYFSS